MRSRLRSRRRGFSLLEVMMVVAVTGILAAIALPRVSLIAQQRRADLEVKKVHKRIEKARDEARANIQCVKVTRSGAAQLTFEFLQTSAGATCTTTVLDTEVENFSATFVSITTFTMTFNQNSRITTGSGNSVPFTVSGIVNGSSTAHSFSALRTLGLVRQLS